MKLTKFTVKNFRSITDCSEIHLNDYSVLVGRNNEGKTTVLLALKLAMDTLISHARFLRIRGNLRNNYEWERDFPISLQRKPRIKKITVFKLNFELTEEERSEFYSEIRSKINGDLCIEISFNNDNSCEILVPKRGSSSLSSKSNKIAKYIAKKIRFTYIPAVRTEKEAVSVIHEMIEEELEKLESEIEYKNALEVIERLQQPVLDKVAFSIKNSLHKFLPHINSVELSISEFERKYRLRKDYVIEIDDGDRTDIKFKGDGVKSLAAIGLLKDKDSIHNGASIIAIEEPESHLHPSAMHGLKSAIGELAKENQLVISTHNPIFVDREILSNNILVSNNKVKSVRKINEIRDCLGVRISDSLDLAKKIILVEGECDEIFFKRLILEKSSKLAKQIKDGELVIKRINSASKLSYNLKFYTEMLCSCFVLLDNDSASKSEVSRLVETKELDNRSYSYIIVQGKIESELEDLIKFDSYKNIVDDEFGINLKSVNFSKEKSKWSDALKKVLSSNGKELNQRALNEIKKNIAQKMDSGNIVEHIMDHNHTVLDNIIEQIEIKFLI